MLTEQFIISIQNDIKRCETEVNEGNNATRKELFNELIGKYSHRSKDFPDVETNPLFLEHHPNIIRDNIIKIKGFLDGYILNECKDCNTITHPQAAINITNTLSSETNVVISFDEAKNKIKTLNNLSYDEITEILERISSLEAIVNSKDKKNSKWERSKPIMKWIIDKGLDVTLTVLPLILQIK